MKIFFLEGDMSRKGGTERMTAHLANTLSDKHSVTVVSLKMNENEIFFPLAPEVTHTVLSPAKGKAAVLHHIRELHRMIRDSDTDIVINVDMGMGIYGVPACRGTGAKVITWEHGNYFNNWNSRLFPYIRRYAAKHGDATVVLTESDKKNYTDNIRTKAPIIVIPNPAERRDFSYDGHSKIILSAGALLPIKGYDRAVMAGKEIFLRHPDWQWHICGEGPERENLESMIKESHLEQNIILRGNVRDMAEEYRRSAMCVMTSHMEGLPMVLLEAKSFGLPLVSFDIMTGPRDIIRDGVNGFLAEKDNLTDLCAKICRLIEDDALRLDFSSKSDLDMDQFSMERIVEKWENLMETLHQKSH
ncbi:MAG: glycosyltransferase family 4 protein [Oscillospiraceae bacterium]|nr:glycosyltransferase family 4 protein [Oscillospiraceae bacterium]